MEDPALLYSLVAAVVLSVPIFSLGRRAGIEEEGVKIVREAAAAGRVAQGTLESSFRVPGTGGRRSRYRQEVYWVAYAYEVDGVRYTYRTRGTVRGDAPPQTLPLYYPQGRPDKALPEANRKRGVRFGLWVLAPLALWAVLYYGIKFFG